MNEVFDLTSGHYDFKLNVFLEKTRKDYLVHQPEYEKITVTFTTEDDYNYSCIYFYKSYEDIYYLIRQGQPLDLRYTYIKDFDITAIKIHEDCTLDDFNATLSFWDGDVNFSSANFGDDDVNFSSANFGDGDVNFSSANFGDGDVNFSSAQFGDGDVNFSSAQFGDGDVNFINAQFGDGDVNFDGAKLGNGNVYFSFAQFGDGNVSFIEANFEDSNVDFTRTNFGDGNVSFSFAQFGDGNVDFFEANFGNGNVHFIKANFGDGNVHFNRTKFGNGYVSFSGAKFRNGYVDFSETNFGNGYVDFLKANFGDGNVDFLKANFGDGNVDFFEANFGGGNVSFRRANFGDGNVDFSRANFGDGNVDFSRAKFGVGNVDFSRAKFGVGNVNFTEAHLGNGNVDFRDTSVKSIKFYRNTFSSHLDLRFYKIDELIVKDCIIEKTVKCKSSIRYNKLSFLNTNNLGQIYINWNNNLYKAINDKNSTSDEKASQFRMLKENFHNIGYYDDEDKAYRAYMQFKTNNLKQFWMKFFGLIGGYGTQAWKVILAALVVIAAFGGIFTAPMQLAETLPNDIAFSCSFFKGLYFSTITFLTIGYGDISPPNQTVALLAGIEGFLGLFLMSYFTVCVVRKLLR